MKKISTAAAKQTKNFQDQKLTIFLRVTTSGCASWCSRFGLQDAVSWPCSGPPTAVFYPWRNLISACFAVDPLEMPPTHGFH